MTRIMIPKSIYTERIPTLFQLYHINTKLNRWNARALPLIG